MRQLKQHRRLWIKIFPLLIGLVISLLLSTGLIQNPVISFSFQSDTAVLIVLVATLASLITVVVFWISSRLFDIAAQMKTVRGEESSLRNTLINNLRHEVIGKAATDLKIAATYITSTHNFNEGLGIVENKGIQLKKAATELGRLDSLGRPNFSIDTSKSSVKIHEVIYQCIQEISSKKVDSLEGKEAEELEEIRIKLDDHREFAKMAKPYGLIIMDSVYKHPTEQTRDLEADEFYLRMAFKNLIGNAMKYRIPNSSVTISAQSDSRNWITISIRNIGETIPEDELALVSNIFHRGSNVKNDVEGTGIGLSLVETIINAHKGKFEIHNTDAKDGVVASISLPAYVNPERQQATFASRVAYAIAFSSIVLLVILLVFILSQVPAT